MADQQMDAFTLAAAPARARSSDPATSKAAAKSVQNVRASHARVLAMFKLYGNMTDEQLADYLHDAEKQGGLKLMSPSGIRSRRSELSKANMDRLDELAVARVVDAKCFDDCTPRMQTMLRDALRIEGFRVPLWDVGERRTLTSGRSATVWGIAR